MKKKKEVGMGGVRKRMEADVIQFSRQREKRPEHRRGVTLTDIIMG